MRPLVAFLTGFCFIVATLTVQAWNKPTHMAVAAIAYADLNEQNPAVITKVVELLKQHPQFESKWAPKLKQVSAQDQGLYLFMLAARWSDDVRGDANYDKPEWHYVDIPYRPGEAGPQNPPNEGILIALPENRSIANSADAEVKARAIALCWMLHLMGDVHQPLHSTTLVTKQFPEPEGDRGGTRFCIRVSPGRSTISLHEFWDNLILGSDKFRTVRNAATLLRNMPDLTRDTFAEQLAVKQFEDWALASYKVAVDKVYLEGKLQGNKDKNNGLVLPADYKGPAKETAKRQIMLAGYRISDAMVELFR
jgi:hypothetical protein